MEEGQWIKLQSDIWDNMFLIGVTFKDNSQFYIFIIRPYSMKLSLNICTKRFYW